MALQTAYKQFLAAPSSDALAANASLNYITTTTAYNGPTEIIKHISSQQKQMKKKKEDFLNVVEGKDSIAVEVETSLQFATSGGAYLPALDDNFLADRTVHLAIVHIVAFDSNGKISRIRQSWDQGSLLKQIEVIGKTGRNWPIRDSAEQIKMIINSAQGVAGTSATADNTIARSRGNSTNVLRDPHASLSLFGSREEIEAADPSSVVSPYGGPKHRQRDFSEMISEAGEDTPRAVVSPYAGTKPTQRSFDEIFGDEVAGAQSPSAGRDIAPKIGAGKNFQPSRLFDTDNPVVDNVTPEKAVNRFYRPHATKYNHFDFADGSDPQDAPKPGRPVPKSKHDSNWSFEDFTTPMKPKMTKIPSQAVRHWGNEDDEIPESPDKKPVQPKPRRDAETHFEFQDDGIPSGEPRNAGRPRGLTQNEGHGLYENNLYNEDGSAPPQDPRALGNITNVKDRRKDFDPHFAMTDDSPHHATPKQGKVADDRQKAVTMMEANWASYDKSPGQKENNQVNHGIATAGDGMGGRKGGRGWSVNDNGDEEKDAAPRKVKIGAGHAVSKDVWDF